MEQNLVTQLEKTSVHIKKKKKNCKSPREQEINLQDPIRAKQC